MQFLNFVAKEQKNKNISIYLLTKQNTYDIMLIQSKEEGKTK